MLSCYYMSPVPSCLHRCFPRRDLKCSQRHATSIPRPSLTLHSQHCQYRGFVTPLSTEEERYWGQGRRPRNVAVMSSHVRPQITTTANKSSVDKQLRPTSANEGQPHALKPVDVLPHGEATPSAR